MKRGEFMNEAYQFLLDQFNRKPGTVVAGISGGPDSMALLHLLITIREKNNIEIICAHVNHNVRVESKNEAEYLESFCKEHNIKFEMTKIEEYSGNNFENEARIKRYNFFEKLIVKYNAPFLITAHHGDDLIETVLMRMVRGSTFKGYAGFSKIVDKDTYEILRPFINITKKDIEQYNEKHQLKYFIDATNETDEHTRNRYRKNVLPFLKEEDSNVHEKFLKFSQMILEYNNYIDCEMKRKLGDVYCDNVLNITEFLKLDSFMQKRVINHLLESIYLDDITLINDNHTTSIINLINSPKPNSYVYLPNNIKAIKAYNKLSFKQGDKVNSDYEFEFETYINLPNGHNLEMISDNSDNSNFICRLNSSELDLPLYVRTKKEGDRFEVKNMTGSKKIKDIFIDEKISMDKRSKWPILVDKKGRILWLPGLKKSKYDKSKKESYDIIIKYY